jgi:hypothetical protein
LIHWIDISKIASGGARMIGVTGGATAAVCCFFNSSTRAQRRAPQPRRHAEAQRLMP